MKPGNTKILLVESDADLRGATRELLTEMGYRVASVTGPSEAVELFARQHQEFSLVLLDAYLPAGDGLGLVDRLRRISPGLPALLVSGFGADDALGSRVLSGEVGFLAMPFSAQRLEGKLREVLERQRPRLAGRSPRRGTGDTGLRGRLSGLSNLLEAPWWRLAAAGLALVAIGFALRGLVGGPPRLPPSPEVEIYRSSRIEQIQPLGGLQQSPSRLDWRIIPGARRYDLSLAGVDGQVLWRGSASAPPLPLPLDLRERLVAGVIYYWSVEAFDEAGTRSAASPPAPFWVEPDSEADEIAAARSRDGR